MYAKAPTQGKLQTDGVTAESFEALAEIAIAGLFKETRPLNIVCGPISTGGTGDQMLNFQVFNAIVEDFLIRDAPIFDQRPYEYGLRMLAEAWHETHGNDEYCMPILEVFYKPIFDTGRIVHAWFIPGWGSSFGARWEHEECKKRDIYVSPIPRDVVQDCILNHARRVANLIPHK